jgi:hypothetical protein
MSEQNLQDPLQPGISPRAKQMVGQFLIPECLGDYARSRSQPMVAMPAGREDKVIDLAGEVREEAGQAGSRVVRLITINQSAYPSR